MSNELTTQQDNQSIMLARQEQHGKLLELAFTNNADINSIEKMVQLQHDFEEKEAKKAFFAALSAFQSDIPVIEKKGRAYHGAEYAKFEDIAKAIQPHLATHGLSYRFEHSQKDGVLCVTCLVSHACGHTEKTSMVAGADSSGQKNAIQAVGSTSSYLRRYTLTGGLGVVVGGEDDDGEQSEEPQARHEAAPQAQQAYPDEQFSAFFPKWKELIESGDKSAADIIKMASTRGNMTQEQQQQLKNVKVAQQ